VRDSDGTVIFSMALELTGGSRQTAVLAQQQHKPCLHLSRNRDGEAAAAMLRAFLIQHEIQTLNVAGPRQSQEPGVAAFTKEILERCILQ
jgi:hypothetical protein